MSSLIQLFVGTLIYSYIDIHVHMSYMNISEIITCLLTEELTCSKYQLLLPA